MKSLIHRFAAILGLAAMLICPQSSAQTPGLYPIRLEADEAFAYIASSGKEIFRVDCLLAQEFSQGKAAVFTADYCYFIDREGKNAFSRNFEEIRNFSEELAAVKVNGRWGYIILPGNMVIEPQFTEAFSFSEGLACVMVGDRADGSARYGYINREGEFAIKPFLRHVDNQYFTTPGEFSNGLAAVWLPLSDNNGYKVGYIDTEGKTAIEPQFIAAGNFVGELAPATIIEESGLEATGFIDTRGNFVIAAKFAQALPFSGDLAAASNLVTDGEGQSKWGYIDFEGNWVIKPVYEMADPFAGEIARVYGVPDCGGEAYIDIAGKILVTSGMLSQSAAEKDKGNEKTAASQVSANNVVGAFYSVPFSHDLICGMVVNARLYNEKITEQGSNLEWFSDYREKLLTGAPDREVIVDAPNGYIRITQDISLIPHVFELALFKSELGPVVVASYFCNHPDSISARHEVYCLENGKWRSENARFPSLDLASFYAPAEAPAAIFREVLLHFALPRHGTEIVVTAFAHDATDPPEALSEGFADYARRNPELEFAQASHLFMTDYRSKVEKRPLKKLKLAFDRKSARFFLK